MSDTPRTDELSVLTDSKIRANLCEEWTQVVSSDFARELEREINTSATVAAQLRRENQSYSHEIGILRKHRAYQPDGEPVFQHTFDELLARAEAAEAEVARLTKERDEALDVLKNYIPRNGSLVERAICILEGAAAKETP